MHETASDTGQPGVALGLCTARKVEESPEVVRSVVELCVPCLSPLLALHSITCATHHTPVPLCEGD